MSTLPENELDLDKLFLPAWAQEPPSAKHYAQYEGGGERQERRGERRGGKPFRRDGGPGERPRQDRPHGDRRGPPRREGDKNSFDRERPGVRHDEPRERRELAPPLPEIDVSFVPDERGVESLARQIKTSGRAYPLFDIARLILQKPERYRITFSVRKKPDGQPVQPLFLCALDDTLWLSEDEAVGHVLKNHFATFYQTERTATEPPKGKYTFVAQCGMSGLILGPPNYHDYQNQLRKLHAERFSRMPFEVFKARVKIVRDEDVVKKWIDDQSWKTEYTCLNMPEPLRLGSREAVEQHFREFHKVNIIKSTESHGINGAAARALRSLELTRLVRQTSEDQRRFPLQIATVLSQQFAAHGLQFFKVNKTVTHVSVARPHFLDLETTPVSDGVKRIVEHINAHPRCTRRRLIETLAPFESRPAADGTAVSEGPPEGGTQNTGVPAATEPAPAAPAATAPTPPPAGAPEPTPEQTAVNADLHWLIHQGHVIEFANGMLETAKKPLPRPPKPEVKPAERPAEAAPATEPAVAEETVTEQCVGAETTPLAGEAIHSGSDSSTSAETDQPVPPPVSGPPVETPPTPAESHP
jgi:hypothetical protein